MQYITLGKTGLSVSRLGLGGIPLQRTNEAGAIAVLDEMERLGINYIDTARIYSISESLLGTALKGRRDKFVVATKSPAVTYQAMAEDILRSLSDLQTDYIDLYQLHNPSAQGLQTAIAPGGALEALLEAKKNGIIGHIGFTTHSFDLFKTVLEYEWVETIMFPYNLVEKEAADLLEECAKRNIAFICMKPLAGGVLEDAELALRFVANEKHMGVIIPGMADVSEIQQNAAVIASAAVLTAEDYEKIDALRSELGSAFCRRCGYCAPCTEGINIPFMFINEGYLSRYGLAGWAKERYATLPKKASDCVGCGVCEKRCPYNLPIREMLKRVKLRFEK